jgi:ABC-type transport system substrate-binding protein
MSPLNRSHHVGDTVPQPSRQTRYLALTVLVAFSLLAVACGGSDDDGEEGGSDTTEANQQVIEPTGEAQPGGDLVFALEAETDGWDPTINRWAVSGHQIGQAVFDTLAAYNSDGEAVAYLAEALTPNDDYTEWTITLREGVTFHDGTPLNADAIVENLTRHLESPLTAPAIRPIEEVTAQDDLNALVKMSSPWASFPVYLTAQVGYVVAPSQFAMGDEGRLNPIGTGPFKFEEWIPDNHFTASKYEDYWREGLPYLDSVEFRPIIESQTRVNAIQSGDIDMFHTSDPRSIIDARALADGGQVQIVEDGAVGEESFIMLNNAVAPTDDVRIREALAMSTNREAYAESIDQGIRPVASSPFIESSPWYSQEAVDAYPAYDLEGAKALVEEYEAEVGPAEVTIQLTPVTANREATQFLAAGWQEAGIDVKFEEKEQALLINDALAGNFIANQWRQLGSIDPDGEYVWWDIQNANDIGVASLNFMRMKNQELTDFMDEGRAVPEFEARKEAYDQAQIQLNETIPYLWLTHTLWAIVADNEVRNIGYLTLPDGSEAIGFGTGFAGAVSLTEVWLEQ